MDKLCISPVNAVFALPIVDLELEAVLIPDHAIVDVQFIVEREDLKPVIGALHKVLVEGVAAKQDKSIKAAA